MSLDSMRGSYGRCPPFLVGGLLVVCVILTFNWWSLSSQNYDLIKQIEELGEQLKISSEEQELCVHQRLSAEGRVKSKEEEMAQLRVRLDQQNTENDELKKNIGKKEEEIKDFKKQQETAESTASLCKTELESLKKLEISKDSTIATLRLEKSHLSSEYEKRKQEVQQLTAQVDQLRSELEAAKASLKTQTLPSASLPGVKPSTTAAKPVVPPAVEGMSIGGDHEHDGGENENNAQEREDDMNAEESVPGDAADAAAEQAAMGLDEPNNGPDTPN